MIKDIQGKAKEVYGSILKKKKPQLEMPIRSLSNVSYNVKDGFFKLNGKVKERTLTASTIKTFAQTLRMMAFSKEIIENNDIATKRET